MNHCACGCGELVRNKFKRGHQIRVKNPMSNPESRRKQKENCSRGTWEERWGIEVAERQRKNLIERLKTNNPVSKRKGKTWIEIFGLEKATRLRAAQLKSVLGNSWGKGKSLSQETRSKISKSLKGHPYWSGYIWTPETRLKASRSHKGKKKSQSHRKHISEAKVRWWIDHPEAKEKLSRINKPTPIEIAGQQSFVIRNEPFFSNKRIEDLVAPDQVLANRKIAVFEDGCYWHACFVCDPKKKNIRGTPVEQCREFDKNITETLQAKGWIVIRAWEHEFVEDQDIIGKKFDKILSEQSKTRQRVLSRSKVKK